MGDGLDELVWSDAVGQAEAVRRREVSASELVDAYLARIERFDPQLRSYVTVAAEEARRAAAVADAADADGAPFRGVPVSVKDVVDAVGMPTTHSCKALADNVASSDDAVVRQLRTAGFVILGKSNVPEFCSSMTSSEMNGVCRNPWDPERTPGGSSGGAASALAAGLCAVSHGTDGAGSIRVPASFCGLVGVKPTRGLIGFGPEEGDPYLGTSTDGVLCRSVRDAAALLDVLTAGAWGPRRRMSYLDELGAESPRLRIAVTADFLVGEIDADVRATTVDAARALEERGHVVEEAAPAWEVALLASGPLSVPGPAGLVTAEQVRLLEPRNRPMVEGLAAMTILQHHAWVKELRRASAEFLRFWDRYDVLLSPTCGMLPPSVDWAPWDQTPEEHMATFSTMANFAHPFNVSGQPALTVPVGWSAGGLPIGVQLAGRPHDEGVLLRLARELEEARPWAGRRPPGLE